MHGIAGNRERIESSVKCDSELNSNKIGFKIDFVVGFVVGTTPRRGKHTQSYQPPPPLSGLIIVLSTANRDTISIRTRNARNILIWICKQIIFLSLQMGVAR